MSIPTHCDHVGSGVCVYSEECLMGTSADASGTADPSDLKHLRKGTDP